MFERKPESDCEGFCFALALAIAVLVIILLSFPATTKAGVVEDILRYQDKIESRRKAIVCAALKEELANTQTRRKKILKDIQEDSNKSETLDETYRLLELTHVRDILLEQIKLNNCGENK